MTEARHGLGDPRIPWVVLLDVPLAEPPAAEVIAERLETLAGKAGWAAPSAAAVLPGERSELLSALAADDSEILRTGLHPEGVVLAARHDALDGLAMLTVAEQLLGHRLRSSATGVDLARRGGGRMRPLLRRAWEVAARPPARVAESIRGTGSGDSFAEVTIDGSPRTADLVHAGARAVVAWNDEHDRLARRVAVAVGVSTAGGDSEELSDRSAFLRLRGVEQKSAEQLREELAVAPVQPGAGGDSASGTVLATVSGVALRLAARRLGSTLLVSHLGLLEGTGQPPAFYPVTGGGSGISLGAATLAGRTTLTLRARSAQHADEHLEHLLVLVVDALNTPAQTV